MAARCGQRNAQTRASRGCIVLVLVGLLGAGALRADDAPAHRCAAIEDDSVRLACFDEAFPRAADAAKDFGLSARQVAQATDHAAGSGAPTRITARVLSVTRIKSGQFIVTLDNGQTWRQGEGESYAPLDADETVTIKKAALGSYILITSGGRSIRVRRVNIN